MMKKFIAFMLMSVILISLQTQTFAWGEAPAVMDTEIKFEIDGKRFVPRETNGERVFPLIYEERTYIPARFVAEAIGLEVTWDGENEIVGFISGKKGHLEETTIVEETPESYNVEATLGYGIRFSFNGYGKRFAENNVDLYPLVYKERIYVPVRFVVENANGIVVWDGNTKTIKIDTTEMGYDVEVPENIQEKIIDLKKKYMSDYSNGSMLPEHRATFRENALRAMVIAGFDYVTYKDYNRIIETLPSYAEVYTYYMKNKNKASDGEILKHLEEVYEKGIDCIELTTLVESPNFETDWSLSFVGATLKREDPNQNIKYIIRYPVFVPYEKAKGAVVKNISSGMLLIEPTDDGSFYTFKANTIEENYIEMLLYYTEKKLLDESRYNTVDGISLPSSRINVAKKNGEYFISIW